MPPAIPLEIVHGLAQLATACGGDVPGLITRAREAAPPLADEWLLAAALEQAAAERTNAGDTHGAWWLHCGAASLRTPAGVAQQDEAEIAAARLGRTLPTSKATGDLPEPYGWIVGGQAAPPVTPTTIELAQRNARAHVERLEGELAARLPMLRAQIELPGFDDERLAAITRALATYADGAKNARAALRRAIDRTVALAGGDAGAEQQGAQAIAEIDDATIPRLLARLAEAQQTVAQAVANARASAAAAGPSAPPAADVEGLERAMRTAFEHAWASPGPQTRAAFEQAARARYAAEVAHVADPAAREAALAHYVTHALAQLPPA